MPKVILTHTYANGLTIYIEADSMIEALREQAAWTQSLSDQGLAADALVPGPITAATPVPTVDKAVAAYADEICQNSNTLLEEPTLAPEATPAEVDPPAEAPKRDPEADKTEALNIMKKFYPDVAKRKHFRPLLAEFEVQAFGEVKDGTRLLARVQEIVKGFENA